MNLIKNRIWLTISLLTVVSLCYAQGGVKLYGVDPFEGDPGLYTIDPSTGETTAVIAITVGGEAVAGTNGMVLDPTDMSTVYVLVSLEISGDSKIRNLATLDLATGEATLIGGAMTETLSGIAMDDTGQMYGISGNGSATPETLYEVDKLTGLLTTVVAIPNGDDGEAIAFNSDDGLLYTASGNGPGDLTLTSIDPSNPIPVDIPVSGDDGNEVFGMLYDTDTGLFIQSNIDSELLTSTTAGAVTPIGTDPNTKDLRGLMFFPSKQDLIFYDGFDDVPPPPVR